MQILKPALPLTFRSESDISEPNFKFLMLVTGFSFPACVREFCSHLEFTTCRHHYCKGNEADQTSLSHFGEYLEAEPAALQFIDQLAAQREITAP